MCACLCSCAGGCEYGGCSQPTSGGRKFCRRHGEGRRCKTPGCMKVWYKPYMRGTRWWCVKRQVHVLYFRHRRTACGLRVGHTAALHHAVSPPRLQETKPCIYTKMSAQPCAVCRGGVADTCGRGTRKIFPATVSTPAVILFPAAVYFVASCCALHGMFACTLRS